MDYEPLRVMMARFEERQIAMNDKLDEYHAATKKNSVAIENHEKTFVKLKTERRIERTVIGGIFAAFIAWIQHK